MKNILYVFIILSRLVSAQNSIDATSVSSIPIEAESIHNIDDFGTLYYTTANNTFHKKQPDKTLTYSNVLLGNITLVNAFNPLKISVFYRDFNTAVILDNRLAEIFKIDFNTIQPYKNASHITTGYDNTIWLFNEDTQQLELYDYKANTTRVTTLPIQSNVLDLKSNYNYCWLLTQDYLYQYNYFGSLVLKIPNQGYTTLAHDNGNIILKQNNILFYLKKNTETPVPIAMSELLINQFLLTNETLYIYDNKILQEFQLKNK